MTTDLLTVADVARALSCSRQHVHDLIAAGRLPAHDISTHGRPAVRIPAVALRSYVERTALPARRAAMTTPDRPRRGLCPHCGARLRKDDTGARYCPRELAEPGHPPAEAGRR